MYVRTCTYYMIIRVHVSIVCRCHAAQCFFQNEKPTNPQHSMCTSYIRTCSCVCTYVLLYTSDMCVQRPVNTHIHTCTCNHTLTLRVQLFASTIFCDFYDWRKKRKIKYSYLAMFKAQVNEQKHKI